MIFGISSPFCEQVHLNYKSIFIDCQEIREGIKEFWYSDGFVGKTNKYIVEIHRSMGYTELQRTVRKNAGKYADLMRNMNPDG